MLRAKPATALHHHPPEPRLRLRWHPCSTLAWRWGGRGRGWSLRLDPPADTGSAGRAWHWARDPPHPPSSPRLCCLRRTMNCFQVCWDSWANPSDSWQHSKMFCRWLPQEAVFKKKKKRQKKRRDPCWVDRFVKDPRRPWSSALASGGSSPRWVSCPVCWYRETPGFSMASFFSGTVVSSLPSSGAKEGLGRKCCLLFFHLTDTKLEGCLHCQPQLVCPWNCSCHLWIWTKLLLPIEFQKSVGERNNCRSKCVFN